MPSIYHDDANHPHHAASIRQPWDIALGGFDGDDDPDGFLRDLIGDENVLPPRRES